MNLYNPEFTSPFGTIWIIVQLSTSSIRGRSQFQANIQDFPIILPFRQFRRFQLLGQSIATAQYDGTYRPQLASIVSQTAVASSHPLVMPG